MKYGEMWPEERKGIEDCRHSISVCYSQARITLKGWNSHKELGVLKEVYVVQSLLLSSKHISPLVCLVIVYKVCELWVKKFPCLFSVNHFTIAYLETISCTCMHVMTGSKKWGHIFVCYLLCVCGGVRGKAPCLVIQYQMVSLASYPDK